MQNQSMLRLLPLLWLLLPALHLLAQEPSGPEHAAMIRQLEANGWNRIDTIVTFDPATYEETVKITPNNYAPQQIDSGNPVYRQIEQLPSFPGGEAGFKKYIELNRQTGNQGKYSRHVGVDFVVEKDGTITHVKAVEFTSKPNPELTKEALRLVRAMPNWTPGRHDKKKQRAWHRVVIEFKVE